MMTFSTEFNSNYQDYSNHLRILSQATSYIEGENIQAIIDPSLEGDFELQSIWKIAEIAIQCVRPQGMQRPSISLVLKEMQEAIAIEQSSGVTNGCLLIENSPGFSLNLDAVAFLHQRLRGMLPFFITFAVN